MRNVEAAEQILPVRAVADDEGKLRVFQRHDEQNFPPAGPSPGDGYAKDPVGMGQAKARASVLEDREPSTRRNASNVFKDKIAPTAGGRYKGAEEAEEDGGHHVKILLVGRRGYCLLKRGSAVLAKFVIVRADGDPDGVLANDRQAETAPGDRHGPFAKRIMWPKLPTPTPGPDSLPTAGAHALDSHTLRLFGSRQQG